MRMFLMHYFLGGSRLKPDQVQDFAPNENSARFYAPLAGGNASALSDRQLAKLRPYAQSIIAQSNTTYTVVKTHNWFGQHHDTETVSLIHSAAAVYLVRDPLDVAVSYAAFRNVTIDQAIDWILQENRTIPRAPGGSYFIAGSWSQNVSSWLDQRQLPCKIIRYEDLVSDPRQQFRDLLSAWQVPVDPIRINAAIANTSLTALREAEGRFGFRERPNSTNTFFRSGAIGEGRERLSLAQRRRLIDGCGHEMEPLGYPTDH